MGAVGHDDEARPCERPSHLVRISGFYLDRHEVTVAEYCAAVDAGVVPPPRCTAEDPREYELCNLCEEERSDHPVNGVSWYDAQAYARWVGKRLPTEAELEYVLRGGREGVIYPWGDSRTPPQRYASIVDESTRGPFPEWEQIPGYYDGFVGTAPVGSFPPNAFGVYDICGNVWEWCSDWFGEDYFTEETRVDPQGPPSGAHKILKGGNFHCVLTELRISERHHKPPNDPSFYSGFRCAMDIPKVTEEPQEGATRSDGAGDTP